MQIASIGPRCHRSAGFLFSSLFLFIFFSPLFSAERHIALIVKQSFNGEISFAHRVLAACRHIQWKADLIMMTHAQDLHAKDYDFVINFAPGIYEHPKCKNYIAIFHPKHHFFKQPGVLKEEYFGYDGYLLTYDPKVLLNLEAPTPHMRWYPSAQRKEFQIVNPERLFYICSTWGNRKNDEKFQQLLNLLEQSGFACFYGKKQTGSLYPNSYLGPIPFDADSLFACMAQAGVALVLHSSDHNAYSLPSGRIFEAAAASCVIICDSNAFVKEHFGDSVLYIDTSQKSETIYRQIQKHMQWIWTNKAAALEKARRAHQIYKNQFLLEDQLLRLEAFHEQLTGSKA